MIRNTIFNGTKIASLNNMSYFPDCAYEGLKRPGGGKILLEFIISYLKQNKKKYGRRVGVGVGVGV